MPQPQRRCRTTRGFDYPDSIGERFALALQHGTHHGLGRRFRVLPHPLAALIDPCRRWCVPCRPSHSCVSASAAVAGSSNCSPLGVSRRWAEVAVPVLVCKAAAQHSLLGLLRLGASARVVRQRLRHAPLEASRMRRLGWHAGTCAQDDSGWQLASDGCGEVRKLARPMDLPVLPPTSLPRPIGRGRLASSRRCGPRLQRRGGGGAVACVPCRSPDARRHWTIAAAFGLPV